MKKGITIILLIIFTLIITYLSLGFKQKLEPNAYYQVYLNEQVLGVIKSKDELERYIDKKNIEYKDKFGVKKVYAPTGLIIKKIETYNGKTTSIKDVYNEIEKLEPFTIEGYQFNLKNEDEVLTVYTLSKEIFDEAITNTINTFVGKEIYNSYLEESQSKIETTGSIVENVYVEEDITIKKTNISVNETIYTNSADLSKYLLFGTTEDQQKYTVKIGDTITDVAFDNKISVAEFLISNPTFTSENNLLFPGQEVTIGITDPKISIVMEEYVVKDQVIKYKTDVKYDENMIKGEYEITQEGVDGLERVSQRVKYVNGDVAYIEPISKEELEPAINEVIIKGDKYVSTVGSTRNWLWPTNSGYTITSGYVYRINPINGARELHQAIDIAGTGTGSPIYAVTNGVVSESTYRSQDGNYVCLNHNNGYYTCYAHMVRRNVTVGQTVARGQIIGYVGMTGWATGPHLHFEVWIGKPWMGGYRINPWTMLNRK